MKTIYPLLLVVAITSCRQVSHVPCMPSEPNFTGATQVQGAAGLSFDHIEAQAAVSVLPFLGLTGDYYLGSKGIKQHEYGANLFAPVNKSRTLFISLSGGKGGGIFNGDYKTSAIMYTTGYELDTKFNSWYVQPCIYFTEKKKKLTVSLSVKHEEVFYSKFNMNYYSWGGLDYDTYTIYSSKPDAFAIIHTPFLGIGKYPDDAPAFVQFQIGWRFVSKGFKTRITSYQGGGGSNKESRELAKRINPVFSPFMLNITVGLKLDFFHFKKHQ